MQTMQVQSTNCRTEIYDMKARLKRVLELIEKSNQVTDRNKNLVARFRRDCLAQGLSISRIVFYMNRLWNITRWAGTDLDKMTAEDIKTVVARIRQMDYAPRTVIDHNITIRKFYLWLDGSDNRIKWISTHIRRNNYILPEELLNKEDVQKLIKAAKNLRDEAIINVLWESGVRVGELLWVKLKNVEFDQYGATMTVHGKTGSRRVRLVSSVPALSNWIQHHPNKGEPESPLWVSIGSTNNGKQLKYQSLVTRIKKIARKAGIKKRVNPHTFRHSRATDLAKVLTEAQMKEYFGWTQSSDMASVYVHLSGRDTDHAILRIHGLLTKDEQIKTEQRKTKKCVYCKHENTPESEACVNCGKPLDIENAIQQEKHEKEFLRMLTPEIIETMIQKKVEEILSERGILCNSKPSKS